MSDALARLNSLDDSGAAEALARCCGAPRWVQGMLARRPFASAARLFDDADAVWAAMERADILAAFAHHPRIGDVAGLRAKFASTAAWAEGEQAGAARASDEVLERLAKGNADYEARFGHIFIVCASGKSAQEMLDLLLARMPNPPEHELRVAAAEQAKITRLRLEKLLSF